VSKSFNSTQPSHTKSWPLIRRLAGNYLKPHRWRLAKAGLWMAVTAATTGAMAKLM
jgi:subfamily B ATP-binding cassette protein MsbA